MTPHEFIDSLTDAQLDFLIDLHPSEVHLAVIQASISPCLLQHFSSRTQARFILQQKTKKHTIQKTLEELEKLDKETE